MLLSSPSTAGSSPTNVSNPWHRASLGTENTEFEDLYDVSDDDYHDNDGKRTSRHLSRSASIRKMRPQLADYPAPLTIPVSAPDHLSKLSPHVPPAASAQLLMSPAQVEFMGKQQALDLPTISAPPSLDGSLSSDQLAVMSAPVTPIIGDDEVSSEEVWTGVHLQPGALAILQTLTSSEADVLEQPSRLLEIPRTLSPLAAPVPEMRQQPSRLITSFASGPAHDVSRQSRSSLADLSRLEIPSPAGFFADFSPRTRSTWHMQATSPESIRPATSTTAEQFYRCPWNVPVPERSATEEFYRTLDRSAEEQAVRDDNTQQQLVLSPRQQCAATEIVTDYDPDYARQQQTIALSNLERTEHWLFAQRVYLQAINGPEHLTLRAAQEVSVKAGERVQEVQPEPKPGPVPVQKKVVRFSQLSPVVVEPKHVPPRLRRLESAYYRAFLDYVARTQQRDVLVHQIARFEALQAQRVALRETHRNQLLGKYQLSVVPQSAKKRLSANVARGDLDLTDDLEKLRREKEFEAAGQMAIPAWHVAAMKLLNGGRLFMAPVTDRLGRSSCQVNQGVGQAPRHRARVLDLGGQAACDWGWHCALQYPDAKVYTVTTKTIRQLSNSNIRGPSNHRQVAVERLTRLPFADNWFDLISARELHSILKMFGRDGTDEWDDCLEECMRVLKPDGYLEFSILDSDIINAGPLGLAKSVEFGFSLKTLGYDASPTKLWLGRLRQAGFESVRRAWMCLPLGAKPRMSVPTGQGEAAAVDTCNGDSVANVCSIVGGWSWERWLLRCEMEKVAGELRLADTVTTSSAMRDAGKCLDGVHAIMEEGRGCRSAFRMLNGYARKPRGERRSVSVL
ncbi:Methyltransferase type 11 [Ophiocordyceps camponoti-floridani]|uniref:Methyltransferase type 11 n=1 Tax=Ophiocordyceps camponoti-floridani TaxID=2030778 RepID=A0A8H4Q1B9_9HYPO|nr:Methyltransferase type 11 [Ophiocordyceps camponoti-floridani]